MIFPFDLPFVSPFDLPFDLPFEIGQSALFRDFMAVFSKGKSKGKNPGILRGKIVFTKKSVCPLKETPSCPLNSERLWGPLVLESRVDFWWSGFSRFGFMWGVLAQLGVVGRGLSALVLRAYSSGRCLMISTKFFFTPLVNGGWGNPKLGMARKRGPGSPGT